jgi:5'-nucleotidase
LISMPDKCQILLTNDDGIQSPGLWAAAEALSTLGYVHVVAPREQMSGVGRSLPLTSDGKIAAHKLTVHEKEWTVYAVGGTPAQAVLHGVLEVMPVWPNLVVSGINYGENLGTGVTISGTVGAALEAASLGIPALAASLQVPSGNYLSYSREIDFTAAQYFVTLFARRMLEQGLLPDVDLIKLDVPTNATPATPWEITRQSRNRYFRPLKPQRQSWDEPGFVGYEVSVDPRSLPEDSDIYTLLVKQLVSVTPLSIDMTSRINKEELKGFFSKPV